MSTPWAHARTLLAIAGVGFSVASLGSACLDYAGEDFGTCAAEDAGAGAADCGPSPTTPDSGTVIGSGSGFATP